MPKPNDALGIRRARAFSEKVMKRLKALEDEVKRLRDELKQVQNRHESEDESRNDW